MTNVRHLVQSTPLPLATLIHRAAWSALTLAIVVAVCWLTAAAI